MKKLYLVTGGTGHLGQAIVRALQREAADIRVLCLPEDQTPLPDDVACCYGNICDISSLHPFFERSGYDETILIHAAALITIESKINEALWRVNVDGTKNILEMVKQYDIDRMIYVSSVHAIEELEIPEKMKEPKSFDPQKVHGVYAKSKAGAAKLVTEAIRNGCRANLLFPSGIIGPYDFNGNNHMTRLIAKMVRDKIFIGVRGGYDFVDVRDVADAVLLCEKNAAIGESYILSGDYYEIGDIFRMISDELGKSRPIVYIPMKLAETIAPIVEYMSHLFKRKPLLTAYSLYTLRSNSNYSNQKAKQELNYRPRKLADTIKTLLKDEAQKESAKP